MSVVVIRGLRRMNYQKTVGDVTHRTGTSLGLDEISGLNVVRGPNDFMRIPAH